MTTLAKKRKMRRKRVRPNAEIRRGAGGVIEMIEFNAYRRNPLAPTVFVNKIGGIYRINPHIVKVTMCQLTSSEQSGDINLTEACSLLWENAEWDDAFDGFRWAHGEIRKGVFVDDGRRSRAQ